MVDKFPWADTEKCISIPLWLWGEFWSRFFLTANLDPDVLSPKKNVLTVLWKATPVLTFPGRPCLKIFCSATNQVDWMREMNRLCWSFVCLCWLCVCICCLFAYCDIDTLCSLLKSVSDARATLIFWVLVFFFPVRHVSQSGMESFWMCPQLHLILSVSLFDLREKTEGEQMWSTSSLPPLWQMSSEEKANVRLKFQLSKCQGGPQAGSAFVFSMLKSCSVACDVQQWAWAVQNLVGKAGEKVPLPTHRLYPEWGIGTSSQHKVCAFKSHPFLFLSGLCALSLNTLSEYLPRFKYLTLQVLY